MEIAEVGEYIRASKDVLDILKTLGGLLPKGPDADAAARRLEQAEKALQASEAQLAKALGFKLCQCTFPPQIMLWKEAEAAHICPRTECGHSITRRMDQIQQRQQSSWVTSRRGR